MDKHIPFRLMALFAVIALMLSLFSCDESDKDGLIGPWQLQSDQTDLQISFELWIIDGEENYRIKYAQVLDGATKLPPTGVGIYESKIGSSIGMIVIGGVGYSISISNFKLSKSGAEATIEFNDGTLAILQDQIFVKR